MSDSSQQAVPAIGPLDHLQRRLPHARFQVYDINFGTANTDVLQSHTLQPKHPLDVKFEVIDNPTGGVVFRGTVRKAQLDYIVLQSTVAGIYRVRLFLEPGSVI